jgi:hypothetical protein
MLPSTFAKATVDGNISHRPQIYTNSICTAGTFNEYMRHHLTRPTLPPHFKKCGGNLQ